MFEVGFSEMVVIFALALVVLGPEKLPKLVAQLGRWVGRARAMARQFREQLESEAEALSATEARLRATPIFKPEEFSKPTPAISVEPSAEPKSAEPEAESTESTEISTESKVSTESAPRKESSHERGT